MYISVYNCSYRWLFISMYLWLFIQWVIHIYPSLYIYIYIYDYSYPWLFISMNLSINQWLFISLIINIHPLAYLPILQAVLTNTPAQVKSLRHSFKQNSWWDWPLRERLREKLHHLSSKYQESIISRPVQFPPQ